MKIKILLLLVIFSLISTSLYSATLIVDDNYPKMCEKSICIGPFCIGAFGKGYKTIKNAVKDAKDGDIIKICKGNYKESVIIEKNNLTITAGKDVSKPADVNWYYDGTVLQVGSWSHSAKNFKLEKVSIFSKNNKAINILKAKKSITIKNLIINSGSGYAIYSGYSVDSNLKFIFDNIQFKLNNASAMYLEKGKKASFSNISIGADNPEYLIYLGWGFEANSIFNFEKLKISTNKGTGISIAKGKNISFDTITIENTSKYGIYFDSKISGDITFKNINLKYKKGYGIFIKSANDIKGDNIKINGKDTNNWAIKFDWGVYGNYEFKNVEVLSSSGGVYLAKGNNVKIDNISITSSGKYNDSAMEIIWSNFNKITIENSEINSNGKGIIVNGSKTLNIDSLKVISKGDNGIKVSTNVAKLNLKNSCIFNKSSNKQSYGLNIYDWKDNINILNNCFYSTTGYFARDSKGTHKWKGNYWDGVSDKDGDGDIDYLDSEKIEKWVVDTAPLKSCLNNCGEVSQVPKPIAEWRMDECSWIGSSGEVKDSSGNNYNGTAINGAITEGSISAGGGICRTGKFDGTNDYVDIGNVLNPNSNDWSISVWIKWDGKSGENIIYNKESLYEARVYGGYFRYAWRPHWYWDGGYSTPIKAGEWTHIVVTYDHHSQKVYKNGVLTFQRSQTGNIGSNNNKLLIGARGSSNPHNFFNGNIDELKIFDKALSPEQIKEIYNNEKAKKNWDGTIRSCLEICPANISCTLKNGLKLSTYNISSYSQHYPANHNDYNNLEIDFATENKKFGTDYVDNINTTGSNNNPFHNGTDDKYLSIFEGYIFIPQAGTYFFAVNGNDAVEVIFDDSKYFGWYGAHNSNGTNHNKEFTFHESGYYKIKFRHQDWTGGDNYQLYWKKPGDTIFSIVPKNNLFSCAPPKPIAEWRMDACSWTGSSGEVKDSSGNNYNGTAINGLITEGSISAGGGICRTGKFDGTNDYVDIGNVLNPNSNDWSISVWIKWDGKSGENIIYNKENLYEARVYGGYFRYAWRPHWYWDGGYSTPIKAGEWTHIVVTYDHHSQKVYKNGVLTFQRSQTGNIGSNNNKLLIGARGSSNPHNYFKGNIDELKIFKRALSPEQIKEIYNYEKAKKNWDGSDRVCNSCSLPSALDHFEITDKGSDNTGIACEPELICFTAKDKDNNTITNYTGEIKIGSFLNNSSKGKWYKNYSGYTNSDPPTGSLINEGNSTVGYLFQNSDKGNFCIFLTNKHLNNTSEKLKIIIKSASESVQNLHYVNFFKSALKFLWNKETLSPWEKQISCKSSLTNPKVDSLLYLEAITTNDSTGACEALFNNTVTLKGRILYLEPDNSEIIDNPTLKVNNGEVGYHSDSNPDNWDDISLNFTNGKVKLNLLYNDAGKLKLQFAYDLDHSSSGYEIVSVDSNNEITFSPFGIYVGFQNINSKDNDNIASFSTKLKSKRDSFNLIVKGVCYDSNDDTSPVDGIPDINADLSDNTMPLKNFKSDIKLQWNVSNPSGGSGSLSSSEIKETDFNNGIGMIQLTFSDVGILAINSVSANNYIFTGNNIIGWPLHKYIGRFIPDHFIITSKTNGILKENCSSFNYSGDKLTYLIVPSFKIIAQNKDNETTNNYKNNFNFLTIDSVTLAYPTEDDNQFGNSKKIEINITKGTHNLQSNNDGTFNFIFGNDQITYLKNANSKISPFSPKFSITILEIKDKDNVQCIGLPQSLIISGQNIKYGKLKILDNYGAETEDLKLKLKTYFWNNGAWELNTDDSCTTFNKSDFILKNFTDNLDSGETDIKSISQISQGLGELTLSAPGENNDGSVDIDFTSNSYLHENDSLGRATFGIYRGRDRIIMWEEVPAH